MRFFSAESARGFAAGGGIGAGEAAAVFLAGRIGAEAGAFAEEMIGFGFGVMAGAGGFVGSFVGVDRTGLGGAGEIGALVAFTTGGGGTVRDNFPPADDGFLERAAVAALGVGSVEGGDTGALGEGGMGEAGAVTTACGRRVMEDFCVERRPGGTEGFFPAAGVGLGGTGVNAFLGAAGKGTLWVARRAVPFGGGEAGPVGESFAAGATVGRRAGFIVRERGTKASRDRPAPNPSLWTLLPLRQWQFRIGVCGIALGFLRKTIHGTACHWSITGSGRSVRDPSAQKTVTAVTWVPVPNPK